MTTAEPGRPPPPPSPWWLWAGVAGVPVVGVVALAYAPLTAAVLGLGTAMDPGVPGVQAWSVAGLGVLVAAVVSAIVFIVSVVASVGLARRRPWGWGLSLALAVLLSLSGCFPVGLALVAMLVARDTRKLVFPDASLPA